MTTMGSWFKETPESVRLVAEETALLEASELVMACLDEREVSRSTLAERLGVSRSEVTQRLNGKRNLTVRTLGAMLHELGYRLRLETEDLAVQVQWRTAPGAGTHIQTFPADRITEDHGSDGKPLPLV